MIIIVWLSEMLPSSLPGSRKEATLSTVVYFRGRLITEQSLVLTLFFRLTRHPFP